MSGSDIASKLVDDLIFSIANIDDSLPNRDFFDGGLMPPSLGGVIILDGGLIVPSVFATFILFLKLSLNH